MIPAGRLIRLVAALAILGVLAAVWPRFTTMCAMAGGMLLGVAGIDAALLAMRKRMTLERQLPGRLALGVQNEISIGLHNPNSATVAAEFFDGLPPTITSEHLPWSGTVQGR